ncbi:hypothetical protein BMF94_0797 [Rhodotorula taiwanensis]|uniref:Mitochondrial carrier n=1 Tax=Rhodotorula taiwanensis TaxID=741276 RepID=A0A2S5BH42_9BASI|nr:hypothetical protein BMF94_0797 [Rhodotorula taiwanensis]
MDAQPAVPQSHPLRPYSVSPSLADWQPLPTSSSLDNATTAASHASGATRAVPPSLRMPTSNRYESSIGDLPEANAAFPNAGSVLRAFVTTSLLSFTGVAMVQPFEVGKTLAQVQWVPRDGVEPFIGLDLADDAGDEQAIEDEGDAEAYFEDLQNASGPSFQPPMPARPTSPSGYLRRSGVEDEALGTKPEWTMPIVVQGGVWDMIKAVGKWKGEGWASLWKGQLTTCVIDGLTTTIQPFLLTAITVALPSAAFAELPLIYSPRPGALLALSTFSHTLTTVLLSPLDLVRTRLIVQSAQPQHRKYKNPVHALRTILQEEGGLWATYFHSNLFFPAVLEGIVRPLIHLSTPLIISRYLRLEPSTSPVWFGLAELVLGTAGLLVTIPLETIRKRLQIQSRAAFVRAGRAGGVGRAWRTCVETRPVPYAGVVEAVYRILTEETGKIPRRRRRRRSSAAPNTPGAGAAGEGFFTASDEEKEDLRTVGLGASGGLRQLYRGFGMGFGANVVVFLLGLVAGSEDTSGWAEI